MLQQIFLLLASTACDLLAAALLARFALQALRAPTHVWRGPVGSFLLAATNWMVLPARRMIPSLGGYDTASLLLGWLWQAVFIGLAAWLGGSLAVVGAGPLLGIAVLGGLDLARIAIYMAMGVVIVAAVFSWINPYAPAAGIFDQLSRPLLRPFRRFVPPLGGVDLSPLVLFLALQVLLIVLSGMRAGVLPLLHG